jgi:hypothetical protein
MRKACLKFAGLFSQACSQFTIFQQSPQTKSIDADLKTDPTRRICISHYEYSELTVHKGNAQLYRFIIEFASTPQL